MFYGIYTNRKKLKYSCSSTFYISNFFWEVYKVLVITLGIALVHTTVNTQSTAQSQYVGPTVICHETATSQLPVENRSQDSFVRH